MDWRARRDSNPQPSDPKSDALSIELRAQRAVFFNYCGQLCQPDRQVNRTPAWEAPLPVDSHRERFFPGAGENLERDPAPQMSN